MADMDMSGMRRPALAKAREGLDPLVRYMIFHWMLGMLGGALCVTPLLVFDPFGIWQLSTTAGSGVQAIFLLYVGFMTSFGGLVCAAAVMFPPKDDDDAARRPEGQRDARELAAAPRLCSRSGAQVTCRLRPTSRHLT